MPRAGQVRHAARAVDRHPCRARSTHPVSAVGSAARRRRVRLRVHVEMLDRCDPHHPKPGRAQHPHHRRTGRSVRRVHHDDSHRHGPTGRRLLTEPVHDRTDRVLDPRQVRQVVIEPDPCSRDPQPRRRAAGRMPGRTSARPSPSPPAGTPGGRRSGGRHRGRGRAGGAPSGSGRHRRRHPVTDIPGDPHRPPRDVGPSSAPREAPSDRSSLRGSQLPACLTALGEPAELGTQEDPDLTVGAPELSGQVLGGDGVVHGGSVAHRAVRRPARHPGRTTRDTWGTGRSRR